MQVTSNKTCEYCDTEYMVEHEDDDFIVFCPFCGEEYVEENDLEIEEWDDED